MGTYTANYQLYMPTVGEQGWGDLMNGNLTTIDTTMAGLNTRVGTLETETDAVAQRVGTLEGKVSTIENEVNGNLVCNSVTATKLCGKRIGVPTTTQPCKWSLSNTHKYTFNFIHNKNKPATQTGSNTFDTSILTHWDGIEENNTCTYTIAYTPSDTSSGYSCSSMTITLTDYLSEETTTQTWSVGGYSTTKTMTGPMLATIAISATGGVTYDTDWKSSFVISRPVIYIKPKGT